MLKLGSVAQVAVVLIASACGPREQIHSHLLDAEDGALFDRSCQYRTRSVNPDFPIEVNYTCRAQVGDESQNTIRFTMMPMDWMPQNITPAEETARLSFLYSNRRHRIYEGATLSGSIRVRLEVPIVDTDDFELVLTEGRRPLIYSHDDQENPRRDLPQPHNVEPQRLENGHGDGQRYCNDSSVISPVPVRVPFLSSTTVRISQGAGGSFSHRNREDVQRGCVAITYAFDFEVAEGTPITAARGGRVVRFRSNSNVGGPSPSFIPYANFVHIEHEDGTLASYAHLRWQGVAVTIGQVVEAGQIIGYSGNTGFTTGPHLHFEVKSSNLQDYVPIKMRSVEVPEGRLPQPGDRLTAP